MIELTIWLAGIEKRTTWGRWVVRSSGKPKAHKWGRETSGGILP
ncbi:MAG TPA: hypothetical protein VN819_04250 [Thermoplasmata archaeon]|nr:hypothetical protein [Thermoplasmata archaeon]